MPGIPSFAELFGWLWSLEYWPKNSGGGPTIGELKPDEHRVQYGPRYGVASRGKVKVAYYWRSLS